MPIHTATIITDPVDGVKIVWDILYTWTPPIRPVEPGRRPEGGVELEGEPRAVEGSWWCGCDWIEECDEEWVARLAEKYGPPSEVRCWEAVIEHNAAEWKTRGTDPNQKGRDR